MRQTLHDIEIICVDDASTDDSLKILLELAKEDKRITVIRLAENLTANQARKDGVLASRGETIMFLDGDDLLLPQACEVAHKAMQAERVDVLHYGAKVINRSGVPEARIQWNQTKIAPCLDRITGDLVNACFRDERFFFTLWNKIFRGNLARKAFAHIEDGKFPRAQDKYAVFLLLYYARSYKGTPDVLMHYHFGTGITGNQTYDLPRFERFCQASRVANALGAFIERDGASERYGKIVATIRRNLLNDALGQWIEHLRPEDSAAAYDLLAENWGVEELVVSIAEKFVAEPEKCSLKKLAQNLKGAHALTRRHGKEPKTIGVFYYRFHSGGVQRVLSLLIPLFLRWGFKVVLITEEHNPQLEYPLPKAVERVLIPPFTSKKGPDFGARFDALARVIREHHIDVLNYHATSGDALLFDLLLAKSMGCSVVLSRHELAFASFLNGTPLPVRQPAIFALADVLTVLTRMDEQYYRLMGVPAVYVPNPIPHLELQPLHSNVTPHTILWVGRMDYVQKQCQEPIEIMQEVVRAVPDAKLIMIGGGWSPGAEQGLRARIATLGLQDNVELCGYTPNPEMYYRRASCHLMTSSWESYGMVISESRAFGLPLVLYDMPYLELLQKGKGYLAVEQSDRRAAAAAIVRLLKDPDLRERLGKEAQTELAGTTNDFLVAQWKQILAFDCSTSTEGFQPDGTQLRMLMENMLELYGRGVSRKSSELSTIKRKLSEASPAASKVVVKEAPVIQPVKAAGAGIDPKHELGTLEDRRRRFGSLGALDFLIEWERRGRRSMRHPDPAFGSAVKVPG
jgi:glycosyltransferase involved in cell wall biosynthesis